MDGVALIQNLLSEMNNAVKQSVSKKEFGIAFSGGVDSSLLSKLCHDLGYSPTLLTVGFSGSHDIEFSKHVNESLGLPHRILEIDKNTFSEISSKIIKKLNTDNLSWKENSIAFYYVSKLARDFDIDTVVTANGIDELFCGYNAYREAYTEDGNTILDLMKSKLENELNMMNAINQITSEFNVDIVQPFLSNPFVKFAETIPLYHKIKGSDDLLRKHIVRDVASIIGVPNISVNKRKKAFQYGSLIHKRLRKSK